MPLPSATFLPSPTATEIVRTPVAKLATAVSSPSIKVYESAVTFQAYPFEKGWRTRQDPANHFTFNAFDRSAFDAAVAAQPPAPKTIRAVIIENEFLRLTFLPELGGRLFQITFKPTNQELFYNNRVLKPTNWGPPNQGGWLAVGGMEWALPVSEHGYEWGIPWQSSVTQDANGATITLTDSQANDRVRTRIQVTLPAHSAYIVVHSRIENPTAAATRLQFWINAQITLNSGKNVSPNTEFILPTEAVLVHSTGNRFIPVSNIPRDGAKTPAASFDWPLVAGRDLSRYADWEDYLGVFVPSPMQPFAGAYNHDTDLGIVRVFPSQAAGVKLFAFGPKFCCRDQISDDDSDYFELWGGLPRTFFADDDVTLAPSEAREWNEYWLPFVRTGGLSAAARDAVLFVTREGSTARVSIYSAVARSGKLVVSQSGRVISNQSIELEPTVPFRVIVPISSGKVKVQLVDNKGVVILETDR